MASRNQRKKKRSTKAHTQGPDRSTRPQRRDDVEAHARRARPSTETKSSRRTTELAVYATAVLAVVLAALAVDADGRGGEDPFGAEQALRYITFLTIGYMLARGLAKAGSHENRVDHHAVTGHGADPGHSSDHADEPDEPVETGDLDETDETDEPVDLDETDDLDELAPAGRGTATDEDDEPDVPADGATGPDGDTAYLAPAPDGHTHQDGHAHQPGHPHDDGHVHGEVDQHDARSSPGS